MNRAFKTEYYPDMEDYPNGDFGKKIVTLSCTVNNGKRFRTLNDDERNVLVELISVFQEQLNGFKKEIANGHYSQLKSGEETEGQDENENWGQVGSIIIDGQGQPDETISELKSKYTLIKK